MTHAQIAGIIPIAQSAALVGANVEFISRKKKKSTKDFVGMGVNNIVGTAIIRATAGQVALL